jgi:glycosyltransferase involved in cell wall biosynthesis
VRILLDARTVSRDFSGVGNYVLELVQAFANLPDDHRYFLLVRGDSVLRDTALDERFALSEASFSHENHPLGDLWEQFVLPRKAVELGIDVLHGPAFLIPTRRSTVTKVVTIHDLVAFTLPETIPRKYALYMRWLIRRAARHADRVITDSENVRGEILRILRTDPHRVTAIALGVSPRFQPASPQAVRALREDLGLEHPYLLSLGNLEPRKNLRGLLKAFRLVRDRHPGPLELVIAGRFAWLSRPLIADLANSVLRDSIRTTGFVSAEKLPALYSGAEAFVFPTFGEGFGLPVLEAMACGSPVVASGVSSILEVAGNAAVLVDPHSPESIAQGIQTVLGAGADRESIVRRGLEHARRFSWEKTARETLAVYRETRRDARA